MRALAFCAGLVFLLPATGRAAGAEVDLTLESRREAQSGRVTYVVGVERPDGGRVDLNGYTLDYEFDAAELRLVEARQLVRFGPGVPPFAARADCQSGRCSAGNAPGQDARNVRHLMSLTFDVLGARNDGAADLVVGILDPVFDGVTQATGEAPFAVGVTRLEAAIDSKASKGRKR